MAKRVKYCIGDVFSIPLDENGLKGYGRIVKIDKPIIFIELYKTMPTIEEYRLEELQNAIPLLSVWSVNRSLTTGAWCIIGNIPVSEKYVMPNFWQKSDFSGKIFLIKGTEKFDDPHESIQITEEEIGNAQPYGVYGHEAVRIAYVDELVKCSLLPAYE